MTGLILIAAAAAGTPGLLKAPQPLTAKQEWVRETDYPAAARKDGVVGVVNAIITIAADGRIIGCTIESSSASPLLDEATCTLIRKRAQYDAALDRTGTPVPGVDRGRFAWLLPGYGEPTDRPVQMILELETMPKGLPERAYARIDVSVSSEGRVDDCAVAPLTNRRDRAPADIVKATRLLGDAACAQALKVLTLDPAKGADGKAVRSIQSVTVAFAAKPAPGRR